MTRRDEILSFWFADIEPDGPIPGELSRFWFGGAPETDELIRSRYLEDVQRAASGDYDSWSGSPRGSLALIILLDQFPRNLFRNTPSAFAFDAKALTVCLAGLAAGQDRLLPVVARAFFYLPLEHSESLDMQERSVALFGDLVAVAPPAQRASCASFHDYAVRHFEIIARFGRFPHRNRILGRESTAEELLFLQQPGSSF